MVQVLGTVHWLSEPSNDFAKCHKASLYAVLLSYILFHIRINRMYSFYIRINRMYFFYIRINWMYFFYIRINWMYFFYIRR